MSYSTDDHPLRTEHPWKTKDPDFDKLDRKGMLLSDQIRKFCDKSVRLLIADNYDERGLRPAAYTLRIGDEYVDSKGQKRTLTQDRPSFEMPRNSIVFVSTKEKLDSALLHCSSI